MAETALSSIKDAASAVKNSSELWASVRRASWMMLTGACNQPNHLCMQ